MGALKIIDVKHLAFDYTRRDEEGRVIETVRALSDLNVQIEEGQFVCVLGHNGSGKSTFAKLLNALNLPTEGTVLLSGMDTKEQKYIWEIRREAGMVFQNPDNQIIASVVEEDVGFGPENIGVPTKEIWERVERALDHVHMLPYRLRSPNRLSGGQKQRVAIAGTMAMLPKCIVLDEPTAMLDPSGRAEVIQTVLELNRQEGITIILITHYMEEAVDADRLIVMDDGRIVMDGPPKEIFSEPERLRKFRIDVPQAAELACRLRRKGVPLPEGILKREELAEALGRYLPSGKDSERGKDADMEDAPPPMHTRAEDPVMRVEQLSHVYQPGTAMESYALKDLSFEIQRGSLTALIGHTGSGKSTLAQHLNGLLSGTGGRLECHFRDAKEAPEFPADPEEEETNRNWLFSWLRLPWLHGKDGKKEKDAKQDVKKELRFKVGLVFQYPEYQLFEEDVLQDVMFGPKNQGFPMEEAEARAKAALRMVKLPESHWKRSPFELSGGQKRRAAIAGVLAMRPEVLILDEPTAGLDPAGRDELFETINDLHESEGMTIILISHSMEDVARYAEQVIVLDHGELRMYGTPEEVFSRYRELEKMGLSAPEMTYLAQRLEEKGARFDELPDTVDKMEEAILSILARTGVAAGGLPRPKDSTSHQESERQSIVSAGEKGEDRISVGQPHDSGDVVNDHHKEQREIASTGEEAEECSGK